MPKILGIHGIAQQYRGPYRLAEVWLSGIRDGMFAAGHRDGARALSAADLRIAFFGDLFRPPGSMATADPRYTDSDIRPGLERELLTALYDAAVAADPELREPPGAMPAGRLSVQFMLARLARSKTFARVAQQAFIGDLRQVTAFLTDPVVKNAVLGRVRQEIRADTRVVIGHSLGSVVAYEWLCQDQPGAVELLVTVGSPLGIPNVVFHRLSPAPVAGEGAWPGRLSRWVNVADQDDIVALRKDLAPLFPSPLPARGVIDPASRQRGRAARHRPVPERGADRERPRRCPWITGPRRNGRCWRRAPRITTIRRTRLPACPSAASRGAAA